MNAYQAGQILLCGDYTAYTPGGVALFKRAKRYFSEPQVGDFVYFYSAKMGRVSHVGVVVAVSKSGSLITIRTWEGNTAAGTTFSRDGGESAYKTYTFRATEVGGTHRVNGFGRPLYGDDTCTVQELLDVLEHWVGYIEKTYASLNKIAVLMEKKADPGADNVTLFGHWYAENHGAEYKTGQWCSMSVMWAVYQACVQHRAAKHEPVRWLQQDNGGWCYRKEDGTLARDEWLYIDGRWYCFDGAGMMLADIWHKDGGVWYYLGRDGGQLAGQWLEDAGKWYYLLPGSGAMATCAYVRDKGGKACYVGEDGAWDGRYVKIPGPGCEIVG